MAVGRPDYSSAILVCFTVIVCPLQVSEATPIQLKPHPLSYSYILDCGLQAIEERKNSESRVLTEKHCSSSIRHCLPQLSFCSVTIHCITSHSLLSLNLQFLVSPQQQRSRLSAIIISSYNFIHFITCSMFL